LFVEQTELLTAFSFAVVTSLDSTRDVGPYLRAQVSGAVSLGDGVVLAVEEFETLLHEAGAFVGFDEVSLFATILRSRNRPMSGSLRTNPSPTVSTSTRSERG
jgi:hypothetical protein